MKEGRRMLIHEDYPQDQERVSLASSWNQNWLKILYKINILLILSRIKMYRMEKSEIMSKIPKKSRELVEKLEIDLDMLCKN
jgi:hypothetical protein